MKCKHTLLVSLLVVLFLFSSIGSAFAGQENALNSKLEKMNIPNELITKMSLSQKVDVVKNTVEFVGYKKVSLNTDDVKNKDEMGIMGTIPSEDMDFWIQVYRANRSSDDRERFVLYTNYEWLNMPINRYTDPYGISWDEDNWRAVAGYFKNVDRWHYYIEDKWYEDTDTAVAYNAASGVGWNADLRQDPAGWDYIDGLEGWGRVLIESTTPGTTMPINGDQVHANYAHVKGTGAIGLQFGTIQVIYSGDASADTRGTLFNFPSS